VHRSGNDDGVGDPVTELLVGAGRTRLAQRYVSLARELYDHPSLATAIDDAKARLDPLFGGLPALLTRSRVEVPALPGSGDQSDRGPWSDRGIGI